MRKRSEDWQINPSAASPAAAARALEAGALHFIQQRVAQVGRQRGGQLLGALTLLRVVEVFVFFGGSAEVKTLRAAAAWPPAGGGTLFAWLRLLHSQQSAQLAHPNRCSSACAPQLLPSGTHRGAHKHERLQQRSPQPSGGARPRLRQVDCEGQWRCKLRRIEQHACRSSGRAAAAATAAE